MQLVWLQQPSKYYNLFVSERQIRIAMVPAGSMQFIACHDAQAAG